MSEEKYAGPVITTVSLADLEEHLQWCMDVEDVPDDEAAPDEPE